MTRLILVTRRRDDCVELQRHVARCGITILPYPVLRIEHVDDDPGWQAILEGPTSPDLIVMASPRAPARFADQCRRRSVEHLLSLPAAVIGEGTAEAVRAAGLELDVIGPGTGVGLAEMLVDRLRAPSFVVLACGRHRRSELPDALAAAGHRVVPVEVYDMQPTPPRELPPLDPGLDAVVVTSPRAARLYLDAVGGRPLPCSHWALGPTTRDEARVLGIDCRIPPEPNITSLAEDLCRIRC